MKPEERAAIRQLLESHSTITLATSSKNIPWAASLFYASDKNLDLFFVSDHRTHHARDVAENPAVFATVNADVSAWGDVRGLQLSGTVSVLDGLSRASALAHYLAKFADVKALFEAPKSDNEETIAQRLKAANMYRLRPDWVRLIDNAKWFGYKMEVDLKSK